jgi:hypothetical protein
MLTGREPSLRVAATDVERRVVDVQVAAWFWKRSVVFENLARERVLTRVPDDSAFTGLAHFRDS